MELSSINDWVIVGPDDEGNYKLKNKISNGLEYGQYTILLHKQSFNNKSVAEKIDYIKDAIDREIETSKSETAALLLTKMPGLLQEQEDE